MAGPKCSEYRWPTVLTNEFPGPAGCGAQLADLIRMIMNQDGVNTLLKAKVTFDRDVGVTIGPVGSSAGLDLDGSTITFNKEENEKLYGEGMDVFNILFKFGEIPAELLGFHAVLTKCAPQLK